MKLIRTKYGIYAMEEEIIERVIKPNDIHFTQADTIEELCDTWLIVPKERKFKPWLEPTLSVFDDFEDVLKHDDVYCAIWIYDNDGVPTLKPVAKMNKEGKLELL